jgi:hypothetical protein
MRVTVFGTTRTPRAAVYSVLDDLHGKHGVHVVAWQDNAGGRMALDWAISRPGADCSTVGSVRASAKRHMGQYFDTRAAIMALFKLWEPDKCLVFADGYWLSRGTGKLIVKSCEKWNSELVMYLPPFDDVLPVGRELELCGKLPASGTGICTRPKGHGSAWHWHNEKGVRHQKFWAP